MNPIAEDKSGRVKLTFELELNKPIMDLIKEDINIMTDLAMQGADMMRSRTGSKRKYPSHSIMGHGEE